MGTWCVQFLLALSYSLLQTACKVETHSCRHATKAANKEKNQNQKCIPCKYSFFHKGWGLFPLLSSMPHRWERFEMLEMTYLKPCMRKIVSTLFTPLIWIWTHLVVKCSCYWNWFILLGIALFVQSETLNYIYIYIYIYIYTHTHTHTYTYILFYLQMITTGLYWSH